MDIMSMEFFGLDFYHFLLIVVVSIVIASAVSGVCSCYWSLVFIQRIREYGTLYGNGYKRNLWVHYFVEPDEKVAKGRKDMIFGKELIDETMNSSRKTCPQYLIEEYDVIIIGSDISSLTAAGFLSRAGKKCLILEPGDEFGGNDLSNERFVTEAEDNFVRWAFEIISEGNIEFVSTDEKQREIYDFAGRKVLILKGQMNLTRLERELTQLFPQEKTSLTRFFHYSKDSVNSIDNFVKCRNYPPFISYFYRSAMAWEENFHHYGCYELNDILDFCEVKDKLLRTILSSTQMSLTSNPPNKYLYPLCVKMLDCGWKRSRITGGMGEIPRQVIPRLKTGSKAVHHAKVKRILCRGGEGYGVELESGEEIEAGKILSSIGVNDTYKLLPKKARESVRDTVKDDVIEEYDYTGYYFFVDLEFIVEDSDDDHQALPPEERLGMGLNDTVSLFALADLGMGMEQMKKLRPPDFEGFEDCYIMKITCSQNQKEEEEDSKTKTIITLSTFCFHEWFAKEKEEEETERDIEQENLYSDTSEDTSQEEEEEVILEGKDENNNNYLSKNAKWRSILSTRMVDLFFTRYPKAKDLKKYNISTHTNLNTNGYGLNPCYERIDYVSGNYNILNPLANVYLIGQDVASHRGVKSSILSALPAVGDIIGRNLVWDFSRAEKLYEKKLKEVVVVNGKKDK